MCVSVSCVCVCVCATRVVNSASSLFAPQTDGLNQPGKTAVIATPPVPVGIFTGESGRVHRQRCLHRRFGFTALCMKPLPLHTQRMERWSGVVTGFEGPMN